MDLKGKGNLFVFGPVHLDARRTEDPDPDSPS